MKRIFLLFTILILFFTIPSDLFAQPKTPPTNFASPNVANLGVYGDIGVDFYTGSPAIKVDLYNVQEGEIKLPISLNYSTSRVRPNNHPGSSGLGWGMSCNWQITRIQKLFIDERHTTTDPTYKYSGFYSSHEIMNLPDWNTQEGFNKILNKLNHPLDAGEPYADDFIFNLPGGYSGHFQMGPDGRWHVTSDVDIQVVFDPNVGFLSESQIRQKIKQKLPPGLKNYTERYFNQFTLITPDGMRYTFGGPNATEYSVNYRRQSSSELVPTSWFLTKIYSPSTGREVKMFYSEGPMICTLSTSQQYSRASRLSDDDGTWVLNFGCKSTSQVLKRTPADGFLIFPVYLDSIKTTLETVVFKRSNSKELRYLDYDFDFNWLFDRLSDSNIEDKRAFYNYFEQASDDNGLRQQLQWQKLDSIKIKYTDNKPLKQFEFAYTNSESTRLKLLSIQERDKNGIAKPPYLFTYKPSSFQGYCSDRADHWGFNNAFDTANVSWSNLTQFIAQYIGAREPDSTGVFCQSELLDTLYYPTSGFTVFEFESHKYSKVVDKNRTSFTTLTKDKFAGGVRIKRIKSFPDKFSTPLIKEYLYKANYLGQSTPDALVSSGVLGGLFEYKWFNYTGKDIGKAPFIYDMFSSGSLLPSPNNTEGNHIGYTEVIEINLGNGFTKYTFTNFDTKVAGLYPHIDEAALFLSDSKRSVYSPFTSKAMERGKLSKVEVFNKYNQKVKESSFGYSKTSDNYQKGIQLGFLDICVRDKASAIAFFGTAFKNYTYSYILTSEVEKTYPTDDPGNEQRALFNQTIYEYNLNRKLVKATIKTQSDGSKIITYNNYPFDYENVLDTAEVYLKLMASDTVHLINSLVSQEIFKKHINGDTEIIGGKIFRYGKNYLPISIFNLELEISTNRPYTSYLNHPPSGHSILIPTDLPYKKVGEIQYDRYGNICEMKQPSQPTISYIWSYNHLFQVAKIVNATNQEIASTLGYTNYKELSSALGVTYSIVNSNKVNSLRTLISKSRVNSATYDTLLGITSLTDENGKLLYYQYDNFNRPHLIKDNDQNIIKSFRYNYKTNP